MEKKAKKEHQEGQEKYKDRETKKRESAKEQRREIKWECKLKGVH